jgi:hypothetical protein
VLVLAQVATAQVCFEPLTTVNQGIYAYDLLATDLDGDGDTDLVTTGPKLSVFLNHGNGMFAPVVQYAGGVGWLINGADLDTDGDQDLAVLAGGAVQVFPNLGKGTFGAHVQYDVGPDVNGITSADFDGDGDIDVATSRSWFSNSVSVLLNLGQGSFAPYVQYAAGDWPKSVTSADLDGDGDVDLAVANRSPGKASLLLNQGDGTFAAPVPHNVGPYALYVTNADLNGDGRADLVTINDQHDYVAVLLNQGGGAFAPHVKYPVSASPQQVVATDLDEDGDLDLAAAGAFPHSVSLLLNRGNGTFEPYQELGSNKVYRMTHADFDGDGDRDLAAQNINGNTIAPNITVYRNCLEPGIGYCFGDGSLLTSCPCIAPNTVPDPPAAPGHGCANSLNLDGVRLTASGSTTPAPGTVRFDVHVAYNYVGFGLMVKGNGNAAAGIAAGDGIRCVDGQLIRFGAHFAGSNGALLGHWTYPNTVQTNPVSIETAQPPGRTAYYQLLYRAAAPNFCNAATTNWSNGYRIYWPWMVPDSSG